MSIFDKIKNTKTLIKEMSEARFALPFVYLHKYCTYTIAGKKVYVYKQDLVLKALLGTDLTNSLAAKTPEGEYRIVVSEGFDKDNPIDIATLFHEFGHIELGHLDDVKINPKKIKLIIDLKKELAADRYACQHGYAQYLLDFLNQHIRYNEKYIFSWFINRGLIKRRSQIQRYIAEHQA